MGLYDVLMGRQQQLNSANNSLADVALSRAEAVNIQKAKSLAALRDRENSFAAELNLDTGSVVGAAVNLGANVYSGAFRTAGDVLATVPDALSFSKESQLTPEQVAAFNRQQQGIATPEDIALLNTATGFYNRATPQQRIDAAKDTRAMSRSIDLASDRTAVVDPVNKNALVADLGDSFQSSWEQTKNGFKNALKGLPGIGLQDMAMGAGSLVGNAVEAAVTHPMGSAEYVAENLPQLVVGGIKKGGKALLGLSNAGYASDAYQKGMEKFADENQGQLPSADQRMEMGTAALGTAILEHAVDVSMLKNLGGKGIIKDPARAGFKESLKNITKASGTGTLNETITEGGQTYLEGVASLTPATEQQIYEGAAIGGITGGGISGGARTLAEVAGATPEQSKFKAAERVQHDAAIQANDTSAYLDPKSPQHSPVDAMKVLLGHAQLDTATPEVKTANYTKSKEVLSSLEDGLQHAKIVASILQSDKEDIPAIKERVAALKAEIVELDQANPEAAMQKRATLAAFEEGLVTKVTPSNIKKQVRDVARRVAELENVRRVQKNLSELVIGKADADTVVSDLATAKAPVVSTDQPAVLASQQAAERLINLSMVSPEHLDDATAVSLANDTQNGLSAPQREYLRQFSAARVAQNQLETDESVANTILYGDKKGNLGLKDYKRYIGTALATGDKTTAIRYMDMLQSFALDHTQKAKVVGEAMVKAIQQGKSLQVIREHGSNGVWALAREGKTYRQSQVTDMGGFVAHPNSDGSRRLADRMPTEATALNQALAAHIAAYQLKFNEAPKGIRLPVVSKTTTQPVASTPSVAPTTAAPSSATPVVSAETQSSVESAASPTTESKSVEESAEVESRPEQTTDANQENAQKTEEGKQHSDKAESGSEAAAVSESEIGSTEKITDEPAEAWVDHAVVKKAIKQAERAYKRAIKANPSSLWTMLKHSLNEVDLSDIYGSDWKKRYTMLKSATAGSLSTRVANGQLDEFLPHNLRFGTGYSTSIDLEGDAVEHIKEKLRSRDYLTEDTHNVLKQLDMDIQQLYAALTLEDIQREIDFAEAQITNDSQASKPEAATTPTEESVGSVVEPASHEAAGFEDAQPVKVPSTEGVLSIFSLFSDTPFIGKDGTKLTVNQMYSTTNLVAQYLKQTGMKLGNASNKPFVAVKDFVSKALSGEVYAEDYVDMPKDGNFTDQQQKAVNSLFGKLADWKSLIKANLSVKTKKSADYRHKDMMYYLYQRDAEGNIILNEHGKPALDENVISAIGLGAYNWIVDEAGKAEHLTKEQVNKMHGKDKDTYINGDAYANVLNTQAGFLNNTEASIGKNIAQALGFTNRDQNTPGDLLPRLEMALGAHAVALLEAKGFIKKTNISDLAMALVYGEDYEGPVRDLEDLIKTGDTWHFDKSDQFKFRTYIQLNRKDLGEEITAIQAANKGSESVLNKLFGVESRDTEPGAEAREYTQKKALKSEMAVPLKQAEVINKTQSIPHTPIADMFTLAKALGRQTLLNIQGFEDIDGSPDRYHVNNLVSYRAQNENLILQFDNMIDLVEENLAKARFVTQAVWKNYRAGFKETAMNLQSSKFHRYFFSRPKWTATITLDDSPKSQALMDEFLISIAMQLGVKTDASINANTLGQHFVQDPQGAYIYQDEATMAAVEAIRAHLNDGVALSDDAIGLIQSVSRKEGMGSLQAMVAYSKYLHAHNAGKTEFEFTMLVGADGKTNGPMLTLLALGAADFGTLNKGGFYSNKPGQAKHFSEYASQGNTDLYQENGLTALRNNTYREIHTDAVDSVLLQAIRDTEDAVDEAKVDLRTAKTEHKKKNTESTAKRVKSLEIAVKVAERAFANVFANHPFTAAQSKAFQKMTGDLVKKFENGAITAVSSSMRNLVKTPLTAFFFGSALKTAVLGMENDFIASFANNIEDIAGKDITEDAKNEAVRDLMVNLNVLIDQSIVAGHASTAEYFPTDLTIQQAIKTRLTSRQESALRRSFKIMMGNAMTETLQTNFEDFIKKRNVMNATVQYAYSIFEAAYTEAKDRKIRELVAKGVMPFHYNKAGEPVHHRDLTAKEEAAVRKEIESLLPLMHTAYSKAEGTLDAAIFAANAKEKRSKSSTRESEVAINGSERTNNASEMTTESPGVKGLPYSIHSSDSFIMHMAMLFADEALNVHDEISTSPVDIKVTAQEINKQAGEVFLNYSPVAAANEMLERQIVNLHQMVVQKRISPSSVKAILEQWMDIHNSTVPWANRITKINDIGLAVVRQTVSNMWDTEVVRNENLAQLAVVDQYTWEGGQYNVPESFTQQAEKQAEEARTKQKANLLPIKVLNAISALLAYSKDTSEYKYTRMDSTEIETNVDDVEVPSGVKTPWGITGKPSMDSEADLVKLFEEKPVRTAKEMLIILRDRMRADSKASGYNKFTFALIQKLYAVLPAELQIKYITSADGIDAVIQPPSVPSRAWYIGHGEKEEIYTLSPEFVNSGLTQETLLHEMLHAALQRVTTNPEGAAKELVSELGELLQKAKDFVGKDKVADYPGLANLHDFIAWGMTNRGFQTSVLNKIELKTKTKSNVMVSGMKKFIDLVTGYLFKNAAAREQELMSNGLAVLIANVSGLMEQAANNQDKTLTEPVNLSMAAQINSFSTLDIHDALDEGKLTPEFNAHLRNVLSNIVERLHGPFSSFRQATMKATANTALGVINEALATGQAPFTSELQASGFKFNNQTFFAAEHVEATVKAVLATKDGKLSAVLEELRKLEAEVRSKLTPQSFYKGDWMQATKDERDEATNLYNYLFKKVDGDYLARFAALGLTHEGFNALLKMPTKRAPAVMADRSAGNMLNRVFDKILEAANGKLTHTKAGQSADAKLASLVRQLVEIENRRKAVLKSPTTGIMSFMDAKAKATRQGAKDTVSTLMNSSMFKKNKNNVIAGTSALVDVVASGRTRAMFQNLLTMRNSAYPGTHGVIASAISEMNGPGKPLLKLLREGKAHLEGTRKKIISYTNKGVLESFADAGAYLTEEAKIALTRVLLRTGSHVLLDHFDMKQLEKLVTDQTELAKEIANFEAKLTGLSAEQLSFVIKKSKALGYHLVTNKTVVEDMLKNANNIAHMYTSIYQGKVSDSKVAEITPIIDSLTSLYALSYTKHADRVELGKVLATENARTDKGNGVEMALLTHKTAEAESKDRLFKDSEVLMMKGYIPEIYNPHTDIKAATAEEGKVLLNLGYKQVSELSLDPNDPYREPRALYVMRDGGLRPWLSGIFSFTGMRAKGTKHHGERAHGTQTVLARNAGTGKVKPGEGQAFDPTADHPNYMAPLLNADGVAVNYQYLMQARTKDVLLERTNQFDEVLGVLAGNIFDKEKSSEHNKKAVQLLYDDFKEGFTKKSASFLAVGPDSTNPELREIYRMLPKKTKDDIRAIWGKDEMLVRVENLDVAFGYRKLSLSTIFEKDIMEQDAIDKALIWFVTKTMKHTGMVFKGMTPAQADQYSKSSAVVVRRGEQVWQEIVREVKDIYVVKNIVTSVNNFKSNLITLGLYGVGVTSGIRDMRIAWVAAEEHQRDSDLLFKLEQQIATGYVKGDVSGIQLEIARLKLALENNPVSEMIAAGLMPTIVEDVSTEDDAYSYKTAFTKKMEKYTNKLNPNVKDVAKNIAMTHDTKMYKSLSRIVQLSDFVARYALYQHLITRKDEPLAKEAALHEASEAFINYDVPMHREFQFMDDMGFFMFTKYFLRAQRVIRGRIKHAPGKLAALLLAESYIGDLPTIIDSSILVRAGNNPLHAGAIQIVGAAGELAPIKMATSLFDY